MICRDFALSGVCNFLVKCARLSFVKTILQMPRTPADKLLKGLSYRIQRRGILGILLGVALLSSAPLLTPLPSSAAGLDRLSNADQIALRNGKVLVNGENGDYVSKVLISAPLSVVWGVLTDYNRLAQFLPGVVSIKVLSSQGNRKVIEQIDNRQIMLLQIRSRLRSLVTEALGQNRIDFQLVEGDLQQFQGSWQLHTVSAAPQVLLTQRILAQPKANVPKSIFYNVFKTSLQQNFNAIRIESERRASRYSQQIHSASFDTWPPSAPQSAESLLAKSGYRM